MHFGGAQSAVLEVFTPAAPEPPPPPPPPPDPDPDPIPATVVGRWVFYNNSAFDGNDPAVDARDDAAIAPDKQALLPGQQASFANYTSYARGINGIMIDVAGLPAAATPTAADFAFDAGSDGVTWPLVSGPSSVTVRRGAGGQRLRPRHAGLARQPDPEDMAARSGVAANTNTGLAGQDVFYFGNAVARPATARCR